MVVRVVHWGTGNTGRPGLRGIIDHPDLELVGLYVHSADKRGRDAGELAGVGPVGVAATSDIDALLALGADCLAYFGEGTARPREVVEDCCRFLTAGTNVVTTSLNQLVYPKTAPAQLRDPLEEACRVGATSFFNNGADPGFANDVVALVMLSFVDRVDGVRVQELYNYAAYDQPYVMTDLFGFGQPLDYAVPLFTSGWMSDSWAGVVRLIADEIGAELDEIREISEVAPAPEAIDIAVGRIDKGTIGAIRFEVQGLVDGRPVVAIEHVTRVHDDAGASWARSRDGGDSYRIIVEGRPRVDCEFTLSCDADEYGGLVATAARVVNAIPRVCAAPPGLLSTLDIPLSPSRNIGFRTGAPRR